MKFVFYILLLFVLSHKTFSSHIVGGEFELNHVEGNEYDLRLILYFDTKNGEDQAFSQKIYARIFRKRDHHLMETVFLPYAFSNFVEYYSEGCEIDAVETMQYIHSSTINLSPEKYNDPFGYYVAWETCCRNYVIDNIHSVDPATGNRYEVAGQTFYMEFPAVVDLNGEPFINSTPSIFRPLSDYACVSSPYWADFSATDPDGDSLAYTLIDPLGSNIVVRFSGSGTFIGTPEATQPAPYPTIKWKDIYNLENIMGGNPDLRIDDYGLLTVTPQYEGLYLFSVECREYRNGKSIGVTTRDFQLYVLDICTEPLAPVIKGKKLSDVDFLYENTMDIIFSESVSDTERCINIEISDLDSSLPDDYSENVILDVFGLNFDNDTLDVVLPEGREVLLKSGNKEVFEICFPKCPFISPNKSPYYEIGIVVYDDYCPVPLTDTLKIKVEVRPPLNKEPILMVDGMNVDYKMNVTETTGGKLSIPILGIDTDSDILDLQIIPINGFSPELAGMYFNELQHSEGQVKTIFNWNFDCNGNANFSEGIDISTSEIVKKLFQFQLIVESEDKCGFSQTDSINMNLTIDFPEENPPFIFLESGEEEQKYYLMNYNLYDEINLQFRAIDGGTDTDQLNVTAEGRNFELNEYGAIFTEILGGSGVYPGSTANFDWDLKCKYFNLALQDTFRTYFIVEDIDLCHLSNADTVTIDFVMQQDKNNAPEMHIENLQGENMVDNYLEFDFPEEIAFNIITQDSNNDSLYVSINGLTSSHLLNSYELINDRGYKYLETTFRRDFLCSLLNEDYEMNQYTLEFRAQDNHCKNEGSASITVNIGIRNAIAGDEEFLLPNVFTPNGDGLNDYFSMYLIDQNTNEYESILPTNNCIHGNFEKIVIVNRWGKEVFTSNNRFFKWAGEGTSEIYYYSILYTNKTYNGVITVFI